MIRFSGAASAALLLLAGSAAPAQSAPQSSRPDAGRTIEDVIETSGLYYLLGEQQRRTTDTAFYQMSAGGGFFLTGCNERNFCTLAMFVANLGAANDSQVAELNRQFGGSHPGRIHLFPAADGRPAQARAVAQFPLRSDQPLPNLQSVYLAFIADASAAKAALERLSAE